MLVCLNGTFIPHEEAKLPINDGGFLYGDTLFETLKARGKKILLPAEHLDRLELSAKLLNFACPRRQIETSLQQLENALSAPISRIRLTLGRGSCQGLLFPHTSEGYFLLTATPMTELSAEERNLGASCALAPNKRVNPLDHLPQMKRGNYADCLYAANYARGKGAREALFVDPEGYLLEGATSNLFAIIEQRLVTPPTDKIVLAGVMRRQIIDTAAELGITVVERRLQLEEIFTAEEAFLSNSLIDILPISAIAGKPVARGERWKIIFTTLRMRIET